MKYANAPIYPGASKGAVDLYIKLSQDMTLDECYEFRDRAYAICKAQGKHLVTVAMNQQVYDEMMASHQQQRMDL